MKEAKCIHMKFPRGLGIRPRDAGIIWMSALFLDGNAFKEKDPKNHGTEGEDCVFLGIEPSERASLRGGGWMPVMYLYIIYLLRSSYDR